MTDTLDDTPIDSVTDDAATRLAAGSDGRPDVWIGHIGPVGATDPDASIDFYEAIGLRLIHRNDQIAALQLRGGTHLVLDTSGTVEPAETAPFDLMVADLRAHRARLVAAGLAPSPVEQLRNHARFWVTDPSGTRVPVYDSHVVGLA